MGRFHPFDYVLNSQIGGEIYDGFNYFLGPIVLVKLQDKGSINLNGIHSNSVKVTEIGIAGAEIIQGDTAPHPFEPGDGI